MYSRRFIRSLTAFVFVGLSFSSTLHAIEYGGFGGRPAYPRPDNDRTESIFVHTLEPGTEQKEWVRVVNNTAEDKTLLIYVADSTPSTGGAFACKQFSEEKKDVGSWMTVSKSEVTLKPNSNEIIPFTIKVPTNASVGEHNGCVLIQEKKATGKNQAGVSLSVRTGIRVAITVPGQIIRKLEIDGFSVVYNEKTIVLHPRVKNSGNVSIDANIDITTRNVLGFVIKKHDGQYPVLRDETSDWNFEIPKPFWGGIFRSEFVVTYDPRPEATVGVQDNTQLTKLVSKSNWFFTYPTLFGLLSEIAILAALGLLWSLVVVARKRKIWIQKNWVSYTVKPGDDVPSLAEKFDVSWKLLAKVNQLKAPYTLKKGQTLKVPPKK